MAAVRNFLERTSWTGGIRIPERDLSMAGITSSRRVVDEDEEPQNRGNRQSDSRQGS